jgi:hypothetical protein
MTNIIQTSATSIKSRICNITNFQPAAASSTGGRANF